MAENMTRAGSMDSERFEALIERAKELRLIQVEEETTEINNQDVNEHSASSKQTIIEHRPRKSSQSSRHSVSGHSSHSSRSSRSRNSNVTSVSDIMLQTKLKAEAAKARLQVVEEAERLKTEQFELELSVQRSRNEMETKLNILRCKQEILESEAELKAVEEMMDEASLSDHHDEQSVVKPPSETSKKSEIVKNYIDQLPQMQKQCNVPDKPSDLRAEAPVFKPEVSEATVLAKYIMRKDMLLTRLTSFDDEAPSYLSWKEGFRNVMSELEYTPAEEMELLIRWLGPESKKQAQSLKIANSHDPTGALLKIWERLDTRYGAPERVVEALNQRLHKFQRLGVNDRERLYELADLLSEIAAIKENEKYKVSLAYLDASHGVNSIISKLPSFMQNKWIDHASQYKVQNSVMYPPFVVFVEFCKRMAARQNDPSFAFQAEKGELGTCKTKTPGKFKPLFTIKKTELDTKESPSHRPQDTALSCMLHGSDSKHGLGECRSFLSKPIEEKRQIVLKNGLCFKCLNGKHLSKDCKALVRCEVCSSTRHCTPFHKEVKDHGGEKDNKKVDSFCTEICGDSFKGKSCAKTVLVTVYPEGHRNQALECYAVIDDQSNRTLGKSKLFDYFDSATRLEDYTISTCSGSYTTAGRCLPGLVVESHDGTSILRCPPILECDDIPDNKREVATPSVARAYPHLRKIANYIPELQETASVLLLIGRDLPMAHHVLAQVLGHENDPYAQQLHLGWAIIGETCLGKVHETNTVNVKKTNVLQNGRSSVLQPCQNVFDIKEDVFSRSKHDESPGLSREDRVFVEIMEKEMTKAHTGKLSAPLPLRRDRNKLPNNYEVARSRAANLTAQLKRNPDKQEHFVSFMEDILKNNHAEEAPPLIEGQEVWYLPIFGVYHPRKPSKIRVVFDSSSRCQGVCLNDILLKGPDLTNSLVGVLLNFRKHKYAAIADVEQMFFNFEVAEEHRDLLRFLWFKDNDTTKPLVEYRMCVHVFGNSPSPAVASYGLRKAVCEHSPDLCDEVCDFVKHNLCFVSKPSEQELVDLIKHTQERLQEGGKIRLHKIMSNSPAVLGSFPTSDLAKNITEIDFGSENPCVQKSLCLSWDIIRDIFTYQVSDDKKPFTKRGLLSTTNGLFDPLGFVAPVILGGRLIMRQAIQDTKVGWDDPLPEKLEEEWRDWRASLANLQQVQVPRPYTDLPVTGTGNRELHVFSDASKDAIAAVAYIRSCDPEGKSHLGFVLGKSKLAPSHGHTIPRLELCAAVAAVELATSVQEHLNIPPEATQFYTDSRVVLGYINNETRRFYVYVANRVDRILKGSTKGQWKYVPTDMNPADHGTRPVSAHQLTDCTWLKGPETFLQKNTEEHLEKFPMVDPETDKEVKQVVYVKKTESKSSDLGSIRFKRFSSWTKLVKALVVLKQKAASSHQTVENDERNEVELKKEAEILILKEVQKEAYPREVHSLRDNKPILKNSSILTLSPVLDSNGLLRVGGRLSNACLDTGEKTPIVIPGKHHVAQLLIRHFHESVEHQGRHLTAGAIRSAGYWLTGGKRAISGLLHNCVKCRKLRRPTEHQKMADLPTCRLTPSPPFTYVGVDTFGPWSIVSRRTRGGMANSKRWAIMFSCLNTRAVHIEVVEDMSASSFINALRRFIAIRGPVKEFFSDRGTNFVGAVTEMGIDKVNVEDNDVKQFLNHHDMIWRFNAPHSSHMSGSWERMIGLARRILESMLCGTQYTRLTHEVLCTLMAEVTCIINSRPITVVSDDPSSPAVFSPNVLLTQKVNSDVEPLRNWSVKDMYKSQWRQVQLLADQFWKCWQQQYLRGLQVRRKWKEERRNLQKDDVVLMIDDSVSRIHWPVGIVEDVYPSSDGLVRKVSVRVISDGKPVTYTRPVTQLVHLLSE